MTNGLKAQLYTAVCRNNFNFSEVERDALYREVIELIEAQEQRIAELEKEKASLERTLNLVSG